MTHFLTSDDKYRDLIYDDDYRVVSDDPEPIRRATTGSAGRRESALASMRAGP